MRLRGAIRSCHCDPFDARPRPRGEGRAAWDHAVEHDPESDNLAFPARAQACAGIATRQAARSATTASSTRNPSRSHANDRRASREGRAPPAARCAPGRAARPDKRGEALRLDRPPRGEAPSAGTRPPRLGATGPGARRRRAPLPSPPQPGLGPLLGREREPAARRHEPPVRAGADAGIFAVAPIGEVVTTLRTRAGMVRHLIGRQGRGRAHTSCVTS